MWRVGLRFPWSFFPVLEDSFLLVFLLGTVCVVNGHVEIRSGSMERRSWNTALLTPRHDNDETIILRECMHLGVLFARLSYVKMR